MSDIPTDLTPAILQGHVMDVLRQLPEASVQCVVTSPPYWRLRAYGTAPRVWGGAADHVHEWTATAPRRPRSEDDATSEIENSSVGGRNYEAQGGESCPCGAWRGELGLEPTPQLFVSHLADVFDEVRRVLRPDGTLWLNLGDTYTTHPSGLNGEKRWKASGLSNRDNTGAEQAGSFDKRVDGGLPEKNLVGIPWRVAFALQDRGWWLRSDCVWAKPNPMPESVQDRPTRSHEYVFLLTKSSRYFYDADAVRTPNPRADEVWVAGGARKSKAALDSADGFVAGSYRGGLVRQNPNGANLKTVWWIPTQPYPESHFATFPEALVETCIRAGTSERGACAKCGAPRVREVRAEGGAIGTSWPRGDGRTLSVGLQSRIGAGTVDGWDFSDYRRVDLGFRPSCPCDEAITAPCVVLDPFVGSGMVLAVARRLGRRSVGVELQPEYVALARRRCSADVPSLERFAGAVE